MKRGRPAPGTVRPGGTGQRPEAGEDVMTDRTTKALLAAIALGLWANVAGNG